jgi:hypothetical protein
VDNKGRRCGSRHRLEFHHREPFGRGGNHSLENLQLMCRTHNAFFAEQDYGRDVMERHRHSAGRVSEPVPLYTITHDCLLGGMDALARRINLSDGLLLQERRPR